MIYINLKIVNCAAEMRHKLCHVLNGWEMYVDMCRMKHKMRETAERHKRLAVQKWAFPQCNLDGSYTLLLSLDSYVCDKYINCILACVKTEKNSALHAR